MLYTNAPFTIHNLETLHKVIVGAHAIMANGGVIAPVGLNMVALAARRHAVPFVVVAGSHKVRIWSSASPSIIGAFFLNYMLEGECFW